MARLHKFNKGTLSVSELQKYIEKRVGQTVNRARIHQLLNEDRIVGAQKMSVGAKTFWIIPTDPQILKAQVREVRHAGPITAYIQDWHRRHTASNGEEVRDELAEEMEELKDQIIL